MEGIKVKLKVDLTKYNPNLIIGTIGYTIGEYDIWSRGSDRFIGVCFPNIQTLDVLWSSLEIIDEELLSRIKTQEARYTEEIKTAKDVIKYLGPKGGFKGLSFNYTNSQGKTVKVTLALNRRQKN